MHLRRTLEYITIGLLVLAVAAALAPATAKTRVGGVVPYYAATPAPYPQGHESMPAVWVDEIRSPGASFLRVHFSEFDLAPGDRVVITDPEGKQRHVYTARGPRSGGPFWTLSIEGDTAVVTLRARGNGGRGYVIDQIGEGFAPGATESTEVVCAGVDGRQDIACFGPSAKAAARPVVRLLFEEGGSFYVCTGALVRGQFDSTLITNNHCIYDQAGTDTLEVTFNFQNRDCGGFSNDPIFQFAGETFLKTSEDLDYTLVTVADDPENQGAGELIPTSKAPAPGARIVIPQHGGGNEKTVGVWENGPGTTRCAIRNVNQTYSPYTPGSQFNYGCDTEGGSSGSPVVEPQSLHMIGLHHLGNVTLLNCSNAATAMSAICADAGPLLNCASN